MNARLMRAILITAGLLLLWTPGAMALPQSPEQQPKQNSEREMQRRRAIEREVRHELVMLPYYGVFDNLVFRVDGNTVTLMGQVTRPTLKSSAENVVKKIEGVSNVVNQIEVLPLSSNDDRIRVAVYRSVYGSGGLYRYALASVPSIHIIVERGHVTLEGVVANEADKNIANIRANQVSGVFSVTNNLVVEGRAEAKAAAEKRKQ